MLILRSGRFAILHRIRRRYDGDKYKQSLGPTLDACDMGWDDTRLGTSSSKSNIATVQTANNDQIIMGATRGARVYDHV